MYFITKAIDLLKDGGQLIVIFPNSWMNARTGKEFQKVMLSQCSLAKKVHIYGDIFEREALVDVAILKLVKGTADMASSEMFLEAKNGKLTQISASSRKSFQGFSHPFSKLASIKEDWERAAMRCISILILNAKIPHGSDPLFLLQKISMDILRKMPGLIDYSFRLTRKHPVQ